MVAQIVNGMKRTRKWAFVAQEAKRLASLGLSASEIGKHIGVTASQVRRWFQDGKLVKGGGPEPGHTAVAPKSPEEWARDVRASFSLDATDNQLVMAGELCLSIWHDPKQSVAARLSAMGRFQAIAKQLNLVARNADEKPADVPKARVIDREARPREDPRRLLSAVK